MTLLPSLAVAWACLLPSAAPLSEPLVEALQDELEELFALEAGLRSSLGASADELSRELARVATSLDVGDWAAALVPFDSAFRSLHAEGFLERTRELDTQGFEAFDEAWRGLEQDFAELAPRGQLSPPGPALLVALEDSANLRAWRYYASSRGQGTEGGVAAGRYYLGHGYASARLARVLHDLPGRVQAEVPPTPRPAALLEALEEDLSDLFRPPLLTRTQSDLTRCNAALGFARELTRRGAHAAALWQALEVQQAVAVLRSGSQEPGQPGEPGEPREPEVARQLAQRAAQLEDQEGDASIAAALLQQASWALDEAATGQPDGLRRAAAIVGPVWTAHAAALSASPAPEPASSKVTVTLVRWPFT